LPSTGGTGGDPGAGGSGNTGATNPGTGGDANPPTGGTSSSDGGTGNVGGGSGATGPVAGTGAGGSGDAGSGSSSGGSSAGTGGTDPCGCTASEACDQNEACVPRVAIDDFVACDEEIPEIEGRSGLWGSFSSELITYEADFGDPGSSWVDHSCAAWMIGGGEATTSDYAGLFVILNADGTEGGGPYSLEGYSGIHIEIESTHQLVLQLRTVGDGYFGIVLTPDGDVTSYDIPFLYLSALDHSELAVPDWGQVTQIQVTVVPDAITDFAFAIHYVGVY
ncbi:MAG TPA: hypothetical protein VGK73_24270, partial [Polyangiaceae bacterium]